MINAIFVNRRQTTAHSFKLQGLFSLVSGEEVEIDESYLISRDNKKAPKVQGFKFYTD